MARRFACVGRVLALLVAGSALPAHALEYLSVRAAATLYDAPSSQARPLFVILAGTPVEQVISLEGWSKVRDSSGGLAWIEKSHLSEKRSLIVRVDRADIRADADDKAALVFSAERDVLLELVEVVPGGWARVRHRDGQGGYVKTSQVWGL